MNGRLRVLGRIGAAIALLGVSACGRKVLDLGRSQGESTADGGVRGGAKDAAADARPDAAVRRGHSCTTDDECAPYNEVCIVEKGRCGECTEATRESQCGSRFGVGPLAQCDPETNLCVECLLDDDCSRSFLPKCHPAGHFCTLPCTADPCFPGGVGVCESGACSLCKTNADCLAIRQALQQFPFASGFGALCLNGTCVECLADSDCTGRHPRCNANGRCD